MVPFFFCSNLQRGHLRSRWRHEIKRNELEREEKERERERGFDLFRSFLLLFFVPPHFVGPTWFFIQNVFDRSASTGFDRVGSYSIERRVAKFAVYLVFFCTEFFLLVLFYFLFCVLCFFFFYGFLGAPRNVVVVGFMLCHDELRPCRGSFFFLDFISNGLGVPFFTDFISSFFLCG